MYDIINTERGGRNPKRKEYITMKLYTVTYEELNAMTLVDIEAMIEAIENDGGMISAEMADRLFGTEEEEYEHNQHTLRQLYQKRRQILATSEDTLRRNLAYNNQEIEELQKKRELKERNKEIWKDNEMHLMFIQCDIEMIDEKIAMLEKQNAEIIKQLTK